MSEDQKILGAHPRVSEALLDLAARVEAGEGSDRELDLAVIAAVYPFALVLRHNDRTGQNEPFTYHEPTRSLDSILVLIEATLPGHGHCYATGWDAEGNCGGFVSPERTVDLTKAIMGCAKTPARALLAAVLKALADANPNQGDPNNVG